MIEPFPVCISGKQEFTGDNKSSDHFYAHLDTERPSQDCHALRCAKLKVAALAPKCEKKVSFSNGREDMSYQMVDMRFLVCPCASGLRIGSSCAGLSLWHLRMHQQPGHQDLAGWFSLPFHLGPVPVTVDDKSATSEQRTY